MSPSSRKTQPPYGLSVRREAQDGTTFWVPEHELPAEERQALWKDVLAEARTARLPSVTKLMDEPDPTGDDEDAMVRRAIRAAALACEDDGVRGELGLVLDEWSFRSRGESVSLIVVQGDASFDSFREEGGEIEEFERHLEPAMRIAERRGYAFMQLMLERTLDAYGEACDAATLPSHAGR